MLVFRWASIYCTGGHNSLTHWITDWNGRLTISHVWQFSHYLPFILSDGNYLCGHHDHNSQSGHPSQNGYSGQFGHSGQSYQSGHPGGFGHHGWCSHPGGLVSLVTLVSLVIQVSHISLVSPVSLATLCMVYNFAYLSSTSLAGFSVLFVLQIYSIFNLRGVRVSHGKNIKQFLFVSSTLLLTATVQPFRLSLDEENKVICQNRLENFSLERH